MDISQPSPHLTTLHLPCHLFHPSPPSFNPSPHFHLLDHLLSTHISPAATTLYAFMLIIFSCQLLLTFRSPTSSPSFSVSLSLNSQSLKHLLITIISLSHSNHLHFFCSSYPAHPQSIPHSHLVFLTILRLSARPPTSFSPSVACELIFIRAQGGPMLRYFSFLFPTWHLCVHCLFRCFSF